MPQTEWVALIKYHELVKSCCCSGGIVTPPLNAMRQQVIPFNKMLPDDYKVHVEEEPLYFNLYQEYRLWLMSQYIDQNLSSALTNYNCLFARKNRKLWDTKKLVNIFGAALKESLFLFETMEHFLYLCEKENRIGQQPMYNVGPSPDLDTLSDIGRVAYKLRLAGAIARNIAGYTNEHEIAAIEELIEKPPVSAC